MPLSYSWNALGHKLIVQIACDQIDKTSLQKLNQINRGVDQMYSHKTLVQSAPWLDGLRYKNKLWLQYLHYIDIPFTRDNTPTQQADKKNAVTAINENIQLFRNPSTKAYQKAFSLRILLHIIGDLHQPMHAVSQFSQNFPKGDAGGNAIKLAANPIADNLHAYWDKGAGLLKMKKLSNKQLQQKARQIEEKWPCHPSNEPINPTSWANESYQLATQFAYTLNASQKPGLNYQETARRISEKRIAQAGCRLAVVMNQLLDNKISIRN